METDSYDLLRVNPQHTTQRQEHALPVDERMDNVVERLDHLEQKIDELSNDSLKLAQIQRTVVEANQLMNRRDASSYLYKKEAAKHFWASHCVTFLVGANVGVLLCSLVSLFRK